MKSIPANPTGDVRRLSLAVREHVHWALANCDAILIAVSGGADSTALAAVVIIPSALITGSVRVRIARPKKHAK